MAFGVLEDKHLQDVPGTGLLSDRGIIHGQQIATIDETSDLKRGTGRHAHVILMPQPSDDPRDPLNWPPWKKEACFWTLVFAAAVDGALSPMPAPAYGLLSQQFGVSIDEVTSSFGIIILGLGCGMLLQGSLAVKYGHRVVYLGSIFLMFISSIWCALSPNLASVRAARVFQGFGMSSLQSLVATTIEQTYFVHERGMRSVIWSFAQLAGITLGPLICSYVIVNLSWQMSFWFVSVPLGLSFVLAFFLVPETTFRPVATSVPKGDKKMKSEEKNYEKTPESPALEKAPSSILESGSADASRNPSPPSYISQLKIWNGTFSDRRFLTIFLKPFPFILSPVLAYFFLVNSIQIVLLSLVPLCSSTIFTLEYNFNATQIGLTNLGGLIGITLGMCITGPLVDWGVLWMAKHNRGIYEPEFRIVFVSGMLFGVFGYVGWAVGTEHNMPWIGAVICFTMLNFSMVISGAAAIAYLMDVHGHSAIYPFALGNFLRNIALYGTTFFANGVILRRGVKVSLLIFAALQAFCMLSSIPMYIYGKRARSFIARHPRLFTVDEVTQR